MIGRRDISTLPGLHWRVLLVLLVRPLSQLHCPRLPSLTLSLPLPLLPACDCAAASLPPHPRTAIAAMPQAGLDEPDRRAGPDELDETWVRLV